MYSDVLKSKRNNYIESYNKVLNTSNSLASSISSLRSVLDIQNHCYSVNDVSGGSNYLEHLLEQENAIYSNLVNNVLPGIKDRVDSLNDSISDALRQESENY